MNNDVLVALDNSEYADKVMLKAIELTKYYGTSLRAVSVIDNSYFAEMDEPFAGETKAYWTSAVQDELDKCQKLAEENDVYFSQEIAYGNPAEEIMKCAEKNGIEIIVLGHLGKSAKAGFLIGSVAQKVAAYSKCSVFIVK